MGKQRDHLAYWADRKTALHMGRQRDHLAHWQTKRPPCTWAYRETAWTWADRETALHIGREKRKKKETPCTLAEKKERKKKRLAHGQTARPKDQPSRPEKDCRHKDAKRTKHVVHTYRLGVGRGTLVAVVVMM